MGRVGSCGKDELLVPGRFVENIGTIADAIEDGTWLLSEIYLKADMPCNVVGFFGCTPDAAKNGDNGDEVDECRAVFAVIDDAGLDLLVRGESLGHVGYALLGRKTALRATIDGATGSLEETAVTAKDFLLRVARETAEGGGAVDNGVVVAADIGDDERAGEINGAENDSGIRTGDHTSENGKEVEARGRVDGETQGVGEYEGPRGRDLWGEPARDVRIMSMECG